MTLYTARDAIAWLRSAIRHPDVAPEVGKRAEVRVLALLHSLAVPPRDPPGLPSTSSLPASACSGTTSADVDRAADFAACATFSYTSLSTSDIEIGLLKTNYLAKIRHWLWMSAWLDICGGAN